MEIAELIVICLLGFLCVAGLLGAAFALLLFWAHWKD